jgi:AraC family transcriptional regulator
MMTYRLVERPAFDVVGQKTWIAGQDNEIFGRFWEQSKTEGLFAKFAQISGFQPGAQTHGVMLGISCVEQDPTNRSFYYMIAIEKPKDAAADLESYQVPAAQWAVFECRGQMPEALVQAEIYAFTQWLPASEFVHASAPEMEVYPPESKTADDPDNYCEFWLPIQRKA